MFNPLLKCQEHSVYVVNLPPGLITALREAGTAQRSSSALERNSRRGRRWVVGSGWKRWVWTRETRDVKRSGYVGIMFWEPNHGKPTISDHFRSVFDLDCFVFFQILGRNPRSLGCPSQDLTLQNKHHPKTHKTLRALELRITTPRVFVHSTCTAAKPVDYLRPSARPGRRGSMHRKRWCRVSKNASASMKTREHTGSH